MEIILQERNKEDGASHRAKVVGSTPTPSTFINLVHYGTDIRLFSVVVGQIQQQNEMFFFFS
jgi:hypothetical protein